MQMDTRMMMIYGCMQDGVNGRVEYLFFDCLVARGALDESGVGGRTRYFYGFGGKMNIAVDHGL